MAQKSSWLDSLEPLNLTTLAVPQLDISNPFLEASNHLCKMTDELFPDGFQIFPSNDLRLVDRHVALGTLCFVGLCLLLITWKVWL